MCVARAQKGEHYHIDDGYDAMNNVYACGLLEDINIEPEQDMQDPSKINIRIKVEEVEPRSMEVRHALPAPFLSSRGGRRPFAAIPPLWRTVLAPRVAPGGAPERNGAWRACACARTRRWTWTGRSR